VPKIITQRRLQRSAKIPDGTSSNGTTAAYAAAIAPTAAASKPIWVINNFSIGTHKISPWRPMPICKGSNRRARVRGAAATEAVIMTRPDFARMRRPRPRESTHGID
jgi:hypothetical protein